ncbi:Hypothetical protein R9X50_00373700 [Acrodontium crateriforme]|uniref:BAR domain-containing protein n=1 Tax=Acrodontium crateriforme TaxID=150365 RepID=A0AAQ3M451_9PEZI|nr:Hypothetical protein R9X50_00373700 [Acrodontium crateriforme]
MSWSGFKKNVGRATTQVMMKTGHVEKTSDREYEVEERRYRTLESASLRLQKEAKGYLDSLRAMTASQMRIAETIDAFYGDSGASDGVSRSYKQAVEDLDAETVKALDGPYRCVPPSLCQYAPDDNTILEIQTEMNFRSKKRNFTRGVTELSEDLEVARMLIESVYRTTVLEPINRFCAYFPDINECIKKRNHKMLDYDSMRAKVKKLTEKPDKDPAKLPRTEKETEMVGLKDFLNESATPCDLSMPSPPKSSRAMEMHHQRIEQLRLEEDILVRRHSGMIKNSSAKNRISSIRISTNFGTVLEEFMSEAAVPSPPTAAQKPSDQIPTSPDDGKETTQHFRLSQSATTPNMTTMAASRTSTMQDFHGPFPPFSHSLQSFQQTSRSKSPVFDPSELEQLMQPLKEDFIRNQADECKQAKAAYLQLNEQLTNELPQLIDLRVPYLDPSFEALVKIQLRFCAEAYSRMAQVQQYLDASTRDQYANGDLDARVEDVLGQIRELSIAGTV